MYKYMDSMTKKNNGYKTGIASEYLVLSMLYRLGANAYLTLGNEKSVDIRVIKDDESSISIDVKSVRSFDSIPVSNVREKDNLYIVVVIYNNKFERLDVLPDFYIMPSKVVIEKRKEFKGNHVDLFKKDIAEYKGKWELLGLNTETNNKEE